MESQVARNIDYVYINCLEAADQLGFTINSENLTDGAIYFKSGVTIWSFGEVVKVQLSEVTSISTNVQVGSTAKAQLFTWGKNSENVTSFMQLLTQLLKTK